MTAQLAGSFPAAFWRLSGSLLAAFRQHAGSSPSHVTRHVTAAFTSCVHWLRSLTAPLSAPLSTPLAAPPFFPFLAMTHRAHARELGPIALRALQTESRLRVYKLLHSSLFHRINHLLSNLLCSCRLIQPVHLLPCQQSLKLIASCFHGDLYQLNLGEILVYLSE